MILRFPQNVRRKKEREGAGERKKERWGKSGLTPEVGKGTKCEHQKKSTCNKNGGGADGKSEVREDQSPSARHLGTTKRYGGKGRSKGNVMGNFFKRKSHRTKTNATKKGRGSQLTRNKRPLPINDYPDK